MRQVAHAEVGAECDASAIVVLAACDDAQKGTFPGSVFGNYAYLVALGNAKRNIAEKDTVAEGLSERFNLKDTSNISFNVE